MFTLLFSQRMISRFAAFIAASFFMLSLFGCNNKAVPDEAINHSMTYGDVTINLQVGESAPDFSSVDAEGNTITLSSFQPKQPVLLVFYRGNWCPFCVSHLDDIQNLFPTLKAQGIQLLAISPDLAADSQELAAKFDQPYVFVSDQDLTIANAYGVQRDESIPHPAVVLINAEGNVVWFFAGENYRQRPSAAQLQQVIELYL
ncbi:peroxiredoxin family protein [Pseudomonadales bacterium]|nr:peroxiredoxin family protein [Pseudomonadales bacterium]